MKTTNLIAILTIGVISASAYSPPSVAIPPFIITEVNPDTGAGDPINDGGRNTSSGGRVNNLGIDPGNDAVVYAASEWGGLWKSNDFGTNWILLENHLPMVTWDVEVSPISGTVYATSSFDGKVNSVAGIQVSQDGGATWTHPATSIDTSANCSALRQSEPSAFGISVRPDNGDVFIGTNCGLARSTDNGVTWTHLTPSGGSSVTTRDVVAQSGGDIDVCGNNGHYHSPDNGATWSPGSGLPGGFCSIAAANANVLVAVAGGSLWITTDATNWTQLDDGISNRPPFVATNNTGGTTFDVFWGDGVKVRQFSCDTSANPVCSAGNTGNGSPDLGADITGSAHDDASDVAFDSSGCPRYFSSDGGTYINTNCGGGATWARAMGGLNALWAWAFDGSEPLPSGDTSTHMGLQDNGHWSSDNGGSSWQGDDCCDGFDTVADFNRSVFSICCFSPAPATRFFISNADNPDNNTQMNPPPGGARSFAQLDSIDQFAALSYVQVTSTGAYITTDEGANWAALGTNASANFCGIRASVSSTGTPVFYAKTNDCNYGGGQLWKFVGTATGGLWTRADNGLTSVGIFAVDKSNPNRLRASDLASPRRMVFSNDGGLTWQADTNLDALMTGNGAFSYQNSLGALSINNLGGYSQPSLVAFDPNNPDVLVAGAIDAGVFASTDGGNTWGVVADNIPRPFHAFFSAPSQKDAIYVASQGRGAFKIQLPEADLRITKSDSPDPVNAGDQLYYTIYVYNDGPDDATNVTVTDALPEKTTFITDDAGVCTETSTDVLTCSLGSIDANKSKSIRIKVKVDPDLVVLAGGPVGITNTAEVSSPGIFDPDLTNNTASESTIVEDLADLRIEKICKPDGPLPAGEVGFCEILVDNLGISDARDVEIIDKLVSQTAFTVTSIEPDPGLTCSGAVGNGTGKTVTCTMDSLAAKSTTESGRIKVVIRFSADDETDINDVATVTATTPDPNTDNNLFEGSISVTALADLSLSKSAAASVTAGESLTYTLTVGNSGPSTATNVLISDDIPAGVDIVLVSANSGGSCNAGVPGDPFSPTTCAFGALADGDTATMTVIVNVKPGTRGILHNDARVDSDTTDNNSANDLDSTATTVNAEADLVITKSDIQDPVLAGEVLDYELQIVNNGPSSSKNVIITDTLPTAVGLVDVTLQDVVGTCNLLDPPATNVLECHIGEILPNASTPAFIKIKTRVMSNTAAGAITNTASVASTETADPDTSNNEVTEDTTVETLADLQTSKTSLFDTYEPSSQIIYTVDVYNAGPSDAQAVVLDDTLPLDGKKTPYLYNDQGCIYTEATHSVHCDFGVIAANSSKTVTIHMSTKGNLGLISNTAVSSSTTPDPDLGNNTAVREVLIKGGVKENGKGGKGGKGGTAPVTYSVSGMTVTVECNADLPRQIDAFFSWLPEQGSIAADMIQVSPVMDGFEPGSPGLIHKPVTPGQNSVTVSNLAGGTVYFWQVGNGNGVSPISTFETPFCFADYVGHD